MRISTQPPDTSDEYARYERTQLRGTGTMEWNGAREAAPGRGLAGKGLPVGSLCL